MNNELIKKIDRLCDWKFNCVNPYESKLLLDCRTEIEFLSQVNEGLRNQNTELDESLAELEAEIERLSKPYIPMTDDEISQMMQDWYNDTSDQTSLPRFIETAVIKRAGIEVKHD